MNLSSVTSSLERSMRRQLNSFFFLKKKYLLYRVFVQVIIWSGESESEYDIGFDRKERKIGIV